MSTKAIISYDGTLNDQDALMLGRLLADAGAELVLAYVRHATQVEPEQELLEEHEAHELLKRGARWLDNLEVQRRVVVSASTAEGLKRLAAEEEADIIVFGSDYRTPAGHIAPQQSTQTLLEGGTASVAIAPADYRHGRDGKLSWIGVLASPGDEAALETARELAGSLGAELSQDDPRVDLLVVGSRPEAPMGHVMISSQGQRQLESASCPVLVVPRGSGVRFGAGTLV